jgi:glycosyltransferase involved in cell wall biosynthesis
VRICGVYNTDAPNANYRVLFPLRELERRGHEVQFVELDKYGEFDARRLEGFDVLHVYRRCEKSVLRKIEEQRRLGVAVTWDNDDDPRLIPPESPVYKEIGGYRSLTDFRKQQTMMSRAHIVTTTTDTIAERYREAFDGEVRVIENYLSEGQYTDGTDIRGCVVIGWVGALEHRADSQRLDITGVLRRVMERVPEVRVMTAGVHLNLDPAFYKHAQWLPFDELPSWTGQFDIGIAPLSDIPMSSARSNVKLKEYAACGVPWLASARGPYLGLGEREGGQLVADDEWEEALVRLTTARFKRRLLGRRAKAWAKSQLIAKHVDAWEVAFEGAIQNAGRLVA